MWLPAPSQVYVQMFNVNIGNDDKRTHDYMEFKLH